MDNAREAVWPLVDQTVRVVDAGFHQVGLIAAVTLPDIAASLSDQRGKTSPSKYEAWVEQWLGYDHDSALRLYKFRCALLHEASFIPHTTRAGAAPSRIFFKEPSPGSLEMHGPQSIVRDAPTGMDYTPIAVTSFTQEMGEAVGRWLDVHGGSTVVLRNAEKVVRRHPNGFGPIVGVPVIS